MQHRFNFFLITPFFLFLNASHTNALSFKHKHAHGPIFPLSISALDSSVHLKDFTRANLDNFWLYPWFKYAYRDYNPAQPTVDSLATLKDHITMVVFGGSWCGDTRDLLPKFYKTVETAQIPTYKVTLIGVDRHKHSHDGRSRKYRIKRVPTFILFYDGKEIGRVVETVNHSIGSDMLNVYHKAGY